RRGNGGGGKAEGGETYARARRLLDEELGVDPGPELDALQRAVLAHDSSLLAPAIKPAPQSPVVADPPAGPPPPAHDIASSGPPTTPHATRRTVTALLVDLGQPGDEAQADPEAAAEARASPPPLTHDVLQPHTHTTHATIHT